MIQGQLTAHMGDKMPFCPRAKVDDGLLDLVLLKATGRLRLVSVMEKAKKGEHVSDVIYVQARGYRVEPGPKSPIGVQTANLDGELVGFSPFEVTCVPGALRVFA